MLPHYARHPKFLFWLAASYCAVVTSASSPTVVELLRALTASGVEVLYSSDLVPPTLLAPANSLAPDLQSRVAEALAAYDLQLKDTGDHRYVVTRLAQHRPNRPSIASTPTSALPLSGLEEVVVFASHFTFLAKSEGEPQDLDRRAVEQIPGTQSDAVRAVRTVPGVASTYSTRPYIRGGAAEDVLFLFDGIALNNPFHFREFQSVLSPFIPAAIQGIDVFSGGFPVRFGTRSAGVIDVKPRTVASGYDLRAEASRLSVALSGAGRTDQWPVEWLASVRRSSGETNVLQPIDANPIDPQFRDALARLRWTFSPNSSVIAGWLLLDDRAEARAGAQSEWSTARSRDEYAWLALDWSPSQLFQSHSSLSYTRSENTHYGTLTLTGLADGELVEEQDFSGFAARTEWAYAPNAELLWNFGTELNWESAELFYHQDETFTDLVVPSLMPQTPVIINSTLSPQAAVLGLFASTRRRWRAFEAEFGLRLDSQDYTGFGTRSQLTPRVNLRLDPATSWHVYASWGQFSQAQRVDEFRVEESQTQPDAPSRTSRTVLGVAHEPAGATRWRAEFYRNDWSNVSPYYDNSLGLVTALPELQPDRVRIAPLGAEGHGIELSAQRSMGIHLSAWGTYTLSRVVDQLASGDVPRSWDQQQAANLGLAWASPIFNASALVGWHSGWPRTSITAVSAAPNSAAYLLLGARNALRWGNYLSIDVHVSRSVFTRLGELSVWMDVANATNRNNDCCTELAPVSPPSGSPSWYTDSWAGRSLNFGFSWRLVKPH